MIKIKKIKKIETKDGYMLPVYKDWEKDVNENHVPKMVYASYLLPGTKKDIILHKKRKTYIACIFGSVKVESLEKEYILDFENCKDEINLLMAEPGVPLKFENNSENMSIILNCPSPSWHPDDEDTYKYKNWKEYHEKKT